MGITLEIPMQLRNTPFKRGRAAEWSKERIEQLGKVEIEQLRENAERLGEAELAVLCMSVLKERPRSGVKGDSPTRPASKGKRFVSRAKGFEARGVRLQDPRSSWSGTRAADGSIVMALWASAVESRDGGCRYLLWAPNVEGSRPWSDKPAGKERLEHCRLALERGAEGLLVHGERLEGYLPEDKARTVHGIDPEAVLKFEVEKHGAEYWAVWGKKTS
jgi:hypothetical protein